MMPATFKEVCRVLEVKYAESGSWSAEDLPAKIQKLEEEVKRERILLEEDTRRFEEKEARGRAYEDFDEIEEETKKRKERVSFSMRIYPLLEMMKAAQTKDVPLMWGVP